MTEKVVKDGKVAVLVSGGYGAGWYSWNPSEDRLLFDPDVVKALLEGKSEKEIYDIAEKKYPDAYLGGVDGLQVEWVPVGTAFRIDEYDGSESLILEEDETWLIA